MREMKTEEWCPGPCFSKWVTVSHSHIKRERGERARFEVRICLIPN